MSLNFYYAFEFQDDDKMPVGYQKIDCHMVFDVKIMLDRKARYVAGGHQTEPTKDMEKEESIAEMKPIPPPLPDKFSSFGKNWRIFSEGFKGHCAVV